MAGLAPQRPARPLGATEVARRRPVWLAISDLWLDTELQDSDLAHMARVLHESGYDLPSLQGIMEDEVAPVVFRNLVCVAGVWDGFDEDWLFERIETRLRRQTWLGHHLSRLRRRGMTALVRDDWAEVLRRLSLLRAQEQQRNDGGSEAEAAKPGE